MKKFLWPVFVFAVICFLFIPAHSIPAFDAVNEIDTIHLHKLLKNLGYPESIWPDLERELRAFLTQIQYSRLSKNVSQARSDPERLKEFVAQIGNLIEQERFLDRGSIHPLAKVLVRGLDPEDIFKTIETSKLALRQKEQSAYMLVACSAVSQLGFIVLDLLEINVEAAAGVHHAFDCIPLGDGRYIFVDFFNQIYEIVDVDTYYEQEGAYLVLKEEYRLDRKKIKVMKWPWLKGERPVTLREILNTCFLYIRIMGDHAATAVIHNNRGNFYNRLNELPHAVAEYNKSIQLCPVYASAYNNRAVIHMKQDCFTYAISDCTTAIAINPLFAEAYYNRAISYYFLQEYGKALDDVQRSERLGYPFPAWFNEAAKEGVAAAGEWQNQELIGLSSP